MSILYFVNFEYFTEKLKEKNIILEKSGLLNEIYDEFTSNLSNNSKINSIFRKIHHNMSDDEKIISFNTRYFIFR